MSDPAVLVPRTQEPIKTENEPILRRFKWNSASETNSKVEDAAAEPMVMFEPVRLAADDELPAPVIESADQLEWNEGLNPVLSGSAKPGRLNDLVLPADESSKSFDSARVVPVLQSLSQIAMAAQKPDRIIDLSRPHRMIDSSRPERRYLHVATGADLNVDTARKTVSLKPLVVVKPLQGHRQSLEACEALNSKIAELRGLLELRRV